MFTFSVLDLIFQDLPKKSIWHFAFTSFSILPAETQNEWFFLFKITLVPFNRSLMDVLLSLIKDINRLTTSGIWNIYSKVTIDNNWCFQNFVSRSVFGELQLTQMSLNLKGSCCNLLHSWFKIRGLEVKLCVAFLLS